MVHVVSCHHFVSQDVFLSKQEPTAFCCSEEKLFIATAQPAINVHDLDSRGNILHTFPTIDQVEQLIFCDIGNYIGTLEMKLLKSTNQKTFVRVYFKWWISANDQSAKVRSPSSPSARLKSSANYPQMVELPLTETALAIACCKKTAVLIVSLGCVISVFCYGGQPLDTSEPTQPNFNHIMDINLNFTIRELAIYECFFACRSENQVRVFKVVAECENNSTSENDVDDANKNSSKILSNGNLDEHFVEWRFESCLEDGSSDTEWENHLKKHLHPDSFPITISFPSIDKANQLYEVSENCEILGPILTVKGHKIKVKFQPKAFEFWPSLSLSNVNVVTLVYREFALPENHALVLLKLVSFCKSNQSKRASLDPLHAAAIECEESQFFMSSLPFQLNDHNQPKAVGCFFSTDQEGFLYDVVCNVEMIGSYHYTATLKYAVLEPAFLHALTDAGLETYTSHLPHRTIQHFEDIDGIKNTCPDFKLPVCLLGLRPFLGVHRLVMSDNHLVLISSMEESDLNADTFNAGSCTIYALRKPSPQQIFSDLLEVAQMCKTSSPTTYQLVLSEGHMILRIHLFLRENCEDEVRSLYLKSCILLADHWACSSNVAEKVLAAPYYHLSKLSVEEVIQRLFGFQNKLKHVHVLKPLIQYLNPVLLEDNMTTLSLSKSVAENILDSYMDESPDHLWQVILCSGITSYRVEKAMMMLKRRITSKRHLLSSGSIAADTFAIVSLLLQKNNTDAAQNMILSLLKSDLAAVLTKIYTLIWSKEGISPLGKFVLQTRPDAFIDMLIGLIENDKVKIPEVLHILQEETSDEKAAHYVLLLKEFLETLIHDKKNLLGEHTECLVLLVKLYLKSLIEKRPKAAGQSVMYFKESNVPNPVCKNTCPDSRRSWDHAPPDAKHPTVFGPRPSWLNEMPPFNSKSISRNCIFANVQNEGFNETECLCRSCNENLLRLQVLLYQHRTSVEIREQVLEFLASGEKEICGHSSLAVLCLDEERALKKLLEVAPAALFPFAQDMFGTDERKWCILFMTMQKEISDISEDDPRYEIYAKTFNGVLQHLAETMTVPGFVSILPKESTYDLYIKLCIKKHRARQLKSKIVALGNEIKALM